MSQCESGIPESWEWTDGIPVVPDLIPGHDNNANAGDREGEGMVSRFRAVEITLRLDYGLGLWPMIWGADVWVNGVPLFKVMFLLNVLGWIAFLLLR